MANYINQLLNKNLNDLTKEEINVLIQEARSLNDKVLDIVVKREGLDPDVFRAKSSPQSELFMV
jgi:hypothetical protein